MRLRATITFEYDANPDDYKGHDQQEITGEQMAAIDQADLADGSMSQFDLTGEWTATVEPVVE